MPAVKLFTLSDERLAEIEESIDDEAGLLIKSSTLRHIIETEVNAEVHRVTRRVADAIRICTQEK